MLQINQALRALDGEEWAHRDLKPDNIMLHFPKIPQWRSFKTMEEYTSLISRTPLEKAEVKIIDFGYARQISDGMKLTGGIGSNYYMHPRVWRKDER